MRATECSAHMEMALCSHWHWHPPASQPPQINVGSRGDEGSSRHPAGRPKVIAASIQVNWPSGKVSCQGLPVWMLMHSHSDAR